MWEALKRVFVGGSGARKRTAAENEDWIVFLARAILFGLIVAFLIAYHSGADRPEALQRGFVALIVALSAMFMGGIIGFLFGIPRSQSGQIADSGQLATSEDRQRYLENTNLEQVSDWLTKIIIGISLVQFNKIVEHVYEFSAKIEPSILPAKQGSDGSVAFVWLIFFFIAGFLFSYLWTRVIMVHVLSRSSATLAAELSRAMNSDAKLVALVEDFLDGGDASDAAALKKIEAEVAGAPFSARQQIFNHARDWRKRKFQQGDGSELDRALPVFRGLIAASPEDYHRNYGQYAYVLKDKIPPDWAEAAEALRTAIRIRTSGSVSGYRIYEANLADCLIAADPDFAAGSATASPKVAEIHTLIEAARSGVDLQNYDRIQTWLALNPQS